MVVEKEKNMTANAAALQINRFASWVHVGPEADACETDDGVECANPLHFHAWVRLPNQLQHRNIREKALAAKARRVRQLREHDSDVGVVLEDELDRLARSGDSSKDLIVDELVARDMWRDMTDARLDVLKEDEEKDEPRFAHIEADRLRYMELLSKEPEDRTQAEATEFSELESHVSEWDKALRAGIDAIVEPKRRALLDLDINALIDQLRDLRIEVEANEMYLHTYALNVWETSTFREPGGELRFAEGELDQAAPEVLEALKAAFEDLDQQQRSEDGNP